MKIASREAVCTQQANDASTLFQTILLRRYFHRILALQYLLYDKKDPEARNGKFVDTLHCRIMVSRSTLQMADINPYI